MGSGEGEPYTRIAVRMPQDEYDKLEDMAKKKGVPLAAFCRWVLQEFLLKESMADEIDKKLFEILESDKYDDIFFEKVTRAMSARRQK
jgi:penicillin V acylase-like amidase (Ntn superfamily)